MKEQINYRGILFVILLIFTLSFLVDINKLKDFVIDAGVWAPLFFVILKIATIVVAPISGSPLYPLLGLLFGFKLGLLYVAIGDFLGYTIAFFIGRLFGRTAVENFIAKNEKGILSKLIEKVSSGKGFFHSCLIFFPLPELLAYSAGLSRLKYWKFILILWPASTILASLLVMMGGIFSFTDRPLILSLVIPLVGVIFIVIATIFFIKDLKKG